MEGDRHEPVPRQPFTRVVIISFLEDVYLHRGVVRRPALGEEAEGGVEPHHVVALEAVLEGSNQERLVGVGIPPAGGGQTLTGRGDEGEIAGRKYELCHQLEN